MRVTSEIWVAVLLRRVFAAGGYAAVVRKGAGAAGAIFVTLRGRDGSVTLYGPAPQASYDEARPDDRQFQCLSEGAEEEAVSKRLEKETRFDSDLWIVECECAKDLFEEIAAVTTR